MEGVCGSIGDCWKGYWEISDVKAHCLLDSGSEGVLLSPEFM